MTLLERLADPDYEGTISRGMSTFLTWEERRAIRRALVIAQVADEMAHEESFWTVRQLLCRTNELLKPTDAPAR